MTEFWVSHARHYCSLCRCWTQGDKESIRRHEQGAVHKEREAARLREKRRGPSGGADDPEVLRQLAQIEAKAAASAAKTIRSGTFAGAVDASFVASSSSSRGPFVSSGRRLLSREGRLYEGDASGDWYGEFDGRSFEKEAPPPKEDEDDGGQYDIRGVRYYQGRKHADKFVTNARCDVWHLDAWRPAVVVRVKRVFDATDHESRTYDVRLDGDVVVDLDGHDDRKEGADDDTTTKEHRGGGRLQRHFAKLLEREGRDLRDVQVKDLRVAGTGPKKAWVAPSLLLKPEQPDWLRNAALDQRHQRTRSLPPVQVEASGEKEEGRASLEEPLPRDDVDENTGMGEWETVAVRQVDEVQEEKDRADAARRREEQRAKRDADRQAVDRQAADRAKEMCDLEERRDSRNTHLGVHDRLDVYKGIPLAHDDDDDHQPPQHKQQDFNFPLPGPSSSSSVVSFKKRRTEGTSFRRRPT